MNTRKFLKFIFNFLISLLLVVVVFVSIAFSANYLHTTIHEEVHGIIFKHYGCNFTIDYTLFRLGGLTIPYDCDLSQEQLQQMNLAHEMNEIVGYNATIFIMLLSLISTILVCLTVGVWLVVNRLNVVISYEEQNEEAKNDK